MTVCDMSPSETNTIRWTRDVSDFQPYSNDAAPTRRCQRTRCAGGNVRVFAPGPFFRRSVYLRHSITSKSFSPTSSSGRDFLPHPVGSLLALDLGILSEYAWDDVAFASRCWMCSCRCFIVRSVPREKQELLSGSHSNMAMLLYSRTYSRPARPI